jgi:release factor glutamine methyltransferase
LPPKFKELCALNFPVYPYFREVTILEVIQRSSEFLAKRGLASPRLQVELLLAHALKMPRMKLYLSFERVLTAAETDTMRELVKRRGQREPLQYITGSTSFCGLEISVNTNVLIPRPETELLAERAWKFLAALPPEPKPAALDLCTGSGCLAIALAIHAPNAVIEATDISEPALQTARENAAQHHLTDRIAFHQGDGFAAPGEKRFDLIVSNPPYIAAAEIETLEPEVRDHEPRLALDGGTDGLDFYRRIAAEAGAFLKPAGRLMLELNDHGATEVGEIFKTAGWEIEAVEADYNQFQRIFIAHKPAQSHDVPA